MTTIWAIHRAPPEAPERFAVVAWTCARGGAPRAGDPVYVATVELGRAAMPAGLVRRDVKPPKPRTQTGKPRRARAAATPAAERELWLPGDFPAVMARQVDLTAPATAADSAAEPAPPAPRRTRTDPDSIVEVWELPT